MNKNMRKMYSEEEIGKIAQSVGGNGHKLTVNMEWGEYENFSIKVLKKNGSIQTITPEEEQPKITIEDVIAVCDDTGDGMWSDSNKPVIEIKTGATLDSMEKYYMLVVDTIMDIVIGE